VRSRSRSRILPFYVSGSAGQGRIGQHLISGAGPPIVMQDGDPRPHFRSRNRHPIWR
jgi:hypothetical protein